MDALPPLLRGIEADVEAELAAARASRAEATDAAHEITESESGELDEYEAQLRSLQGAVFEVAGAAEALSIRDQE
jgi:hypothetical protein